jgi:adenine phosphoribosyltransferase
MIEQRLKSVIRNFPDYPKEGIVFKDISPVLSDVELYKQVVYEFSLRLKDLNLNCVVGVESRGFWFGPAIAQALSVPFIPIRKKGKLPGDTLTKTYDLEYGSSTIEIQKDVLKKGDMVLVHDDLLATGGTAKAAADLVKMSGAEISGFAFIVDLDIPETDQKLSSHSKNIISLLKYY